jgi:hypothetical protein
MGFRNRTAVHDLQDEVAMKQRLSRRRFITSAAVSIVPSAIAMAQPKSTGLLAMIGGEQQSPVTQKSIKADWNNAGVVDLSNSPHAKLKTVPVRAVVAAPVSLLSVNSQRPLSRRFITSPGNRSVVADVTAVSSVDVW